MAGQVAGRPLFHFGSPGRTGLGLAFGSRSPPGFGGLTPISEVRTSLQPAALPSGKLLSLSAWLSAELAASKLLKPEKDCQY